MATNTRKGGKSAHLDREEVRNRIQSPHALLAALDLLPEDAGRKAKYMIKCLWCKKRTLSVWVGRQSVIGTCNYGDCKATYSPLDIIAKARGWEMSGADFVERVLPFADRVGRGEAVPESPQPAKTAQDAPQAAEKAREAPEPARSASPAAEAKLEPAEDPITVRLHPDRTPEEWRWLAGLGVDPHAVRRLGWGVLPNQGDQPPALLEQIRRGYSLWRDLLDPAGNYAGWCGVQIGGGQGQDPWVSVIDGGASGASVVANEFGERMLERGPGDLSAWPAADQRHPTLYLAADPSDFARAEPALQARLHPLVGLPDGELPAEVAARIPPAARRVLLHSGPVSERLREIAGSAAATLLAVARLTPSTPSVADLDAALAGSA